MCKWNQSIGEIWKQAGPPMRSLSSSKDVPFPISKQFLWLLHKTPQHTPTSLSAPQPPSPLILPHPCPTPRGQMLGKTAASGGLRVWVCSAFGCVFVACVACGLIDHSLLSVVGRGTASTNTSIWVALGISASPWNKETRGQGFSLSHQHPRDVELSLLCLLAVSSVSLARHQPGFRCWLCWCGRAPCGVGAGACA